MDSLVDPCLACRLTEGLEGLPGERIGETTSWVVEPCIGPLPIGTLIVKPRRHVVHVADLDDEESTELGPLLRRVASIIAESSGADQVHVCLWSHADWIPGHIHFVIQPSWNSLRAEYERPGPFLQATPFESARYPEPVQVAAFAAKAADAFHDGH